MYLSGCSGAAVDVVFVVDSSGSIKWADPGNWDKVVNFVTSIATSLRDSGVDGRYGLVNFATNVSIESNLVDYNSFLNDARRMPYKDSQTNINEALITTGRVLAGSGNRQQVDDIIIFITDGDPCCVGTPGIVVGGEEQTAATIKATQYPAGSNKYPRLIAVGVGQAVNNADFKTRLETIASTPQDYFGIADFSALQNAISSLISRVCPTPAPAPVPTPAPGKLYLQLLSKYYCLEAWVTTHTTLMMVMDLYFYISLLQKESYWFHIFLMFNSFSGLGRLTHTHTSYIYMNPVIRNLHGTTESGVISQVVFHQRYKYTTIIRVVCVLTHASRQ